MQICTQCNTKYELEENNLHNLKRHQYVICHNNNIMHTLALNMTVVTSICPKCGAETIQSIRILDNDTRFSDAEIMKELKNITNAEDIEPILRHIVNQDEEISKRNFNIYIAILIVITFLAIIIGISSSYAYINNMPTY